MDKFYLGDYARGVLKLITTGGFSVWWLWDIFGIAFDRNSRGRGIILWGRCTGGGCNERIGRYWGAVTGYKCTNSGCGKVWCPAHVGGFPDKTCPACGNFALSIDSLE